MSEDEAARQRQQEINLFAAMANADNDRGTFDFGAIARGEVEGVGDEEQALHNSFKDNENDDNDVDGSRKLFAQAAQEGADSMGTFAFTPTTDNQSKDNNTNTTNNKRSNLEAAAAALDREDNMGNPGGTGATTGSNMDHDFVVPPAPTNLFVAPKLKPKTPMHTQQVFFPRPLVFGSQLPPRVLEQSKQIAKEALDECVANNNSPLPPDVCNLVSAIHMYGNGINILDSNEQNRSHVSSYVSVFCPKWSEVEETPLQDLSNDEPENIGNNNTATGQEPKKSSLPVQMAPAESTQEQPVLSTAVGQSSMETATTTTAASSVSTTEGMSERDLFSLFARGEVPATTTDDDDPILSTSVTSSPTAVRSTITTNSSTTTTTSAENAGASTMDDAALFSQWARGESGDGNNSQGSNSSFNNTNDKDTKSASAESVGVIMDDAALFSQWARGERGDGNSQGSDSSMNLKDTARASSPTVMSDQDLFSQWARGEASPAVQGKPAAGGANSSSSTGAGSGTLVFENSSGGAANSSKKQNHSAASNFFTNSSGTFMNVPSNNDDSDDDSVVGSELKKKVGVNEHLNAALASLEDDDPWHPGKGQDIMLNGNVETESNLTSNQQIPLTKDGGRPLTNHELMNGCTPLFGVDDSPLPTESDLGIHETRDEQQRSRENRKNQAIIENCCPKNVFGPLACPNPALHPDDNHSWNSRSTPSQRLVLPSPDVLPSIVGSNNVGVLPSPSIPRKSPHSSEGAGAKVLSPSSRHSASSKPNPLAGRTFDSRQRFGWWNLAEDYYNANKSLDKSSSADTDDDNASDEQEPLQLPPWEHGASSTVLVQTRLEPQPEKLHEQNRPLSHMHPATSLAQALPFLSDRPPSYRYLQVDTQAVGFPALGGEIEPLFCSLAIYHVETLPHQHGGNDSLAPIPDLQRCGKITETLNFDVVSDANIEKKCDGSLYPYSDIAQEQLQGTRCGVFPLPSNLNIHNLYAILIVHKVISDGEDFEVYLKKKDNVDIGLLRSKAEKASNRHGQFIMPFAFGVAPLLQVFGADVPVVPSSRAVQIPLFRFAAGHGERQIIDHIMVMLYPRADHRSSGIGGPAPVTNGGIAMLVMRNFGYLGLHSVVHSKSSLARNRLVDFTGEMQLRCREDRDEGTHDSPFSNPEEKKQMEAMADVHVVPEWHNQFVSEPTEHGGRNPSKQKKEDSGEKIQNHLYAQELAPLPLHSNPSARSAVATSPSMKSQRGRASSSGDNIEPYYHTTFCNELLCHPRLLHNCPKGNTVIKVEMREMEWKPEYNAFFAHLPESGPFIHNPRRGPFLVSGAYTCCSAKSLNPHFLDEFKLKLPLVLKSKKGGDSSTRVMSLFFSVYKLSFSKSRKKWGRRLRGARRTSRQVEEIAGDMAGESSEGKSSSSCQLVQLACGHLPLASNYSIISNGDHDIKLCYTARNPRREPVEKGVIKGTTLVVTEMAVSPSGDADTTFEDAESVASCPLILDTTSVTSASDSFTMSESSQHGKQKPSVDRISLQVRISVHSSLHTQNATLGEFFCQEPNIPASLKNADLTSLLRLNREEIHQLVNSSHAQSSTPYETDKLMIATVDIAKSSMASTSDVSAHLLRVISQLWKVIVAGTGEPDLEWANPASNIPLRVNAFATLMQLLGSTTIFLSKRGVTQLDGSTKWNLITLSRIVALLFDEENLFGSQAEEPFCKDFFERAQKMSARKATPAKKPPKDRRSRHTRANFEFFNNGSLGSSDGSDAFIGDDHKDVVFGDFSGTNRAATIGAGSNFFSSASKLSTNDLEKPKEADESLLSSEISNEHSKPPVNTSIKMDSVIDFRSALEAGTREANGEDALYEGPTSSGGSRAAMSMIKAFGGMSSSSSRRWMTAPTPGLATIREDSDGDESEQINLETPQQQKPMGPLDALDSEILRPTPKASKQFRVPKLKKSANTNTESSTATNDLDSDSKGSISQDSGMGSIEAGFPDVSQDLSMISFDVHSSPQKEKSAPRLKHRKTRSLTFPASDAELESAGTAFLDAIGKSLGISGISPGNSTGEDNTVGQTNHKKTRSRCSIDWSIPNDDFNNLMAGAAGEMDQVEEGSKVGFDESMSSLSKEKDISTKLPNYIDRLVALSGSGIGDDAPFRQASGRWFPFAYEIVIMQWVAILSEQRASAPDSSYDGMGETDRENCLAEAASRTGGVAIASAPVMFEIIKQSLGWRVANLFRRKESVDLFKDLPPLVSFDDSILASLEQVIALITDACLDSRNFDSWETRQTCIDVNDSILLFLRDLFAFLNPSCVYRLIMVYLSRLTVKRQWRERDSAIGLCCSWEITKLQMNAVSAFVRFPDFIKINAPQMNNWGDWWVTAPALSTVLFFDGILERYQNFGHPSLTNSEDGERGKGFEIPEMRPHWLAETVVDICILCTEHAEHDMQRRGASLLLELFWEQSQQSMRDGNSSIVASMYITFLEKVLARTSYLGNQSFFPPKHQVRQDIIRCVVFVLQSAPTGLLRALWRRLCGRATGKGFRDRYGGIGYSIFTETGDDNVHQDNQSKTSRGSSDTKGPDIFEMFSLLNLSLATMEYEGSDGHADTENSDNDGPSEIWRKEYLLAREPETVETVRRRRLMAAYGKYPSDHGEKADVEYATSSSRKWHAHDGSIVLIETAQQIVRELRFVLEPSEEAQSFFNPARRKIHVNKSHRYQSSLSSKGSVDSRGSAKPGLRFSYMDTVIFVRAATSVYLHSLTLRQSDIALVKTLNASVEIVKIFGIKIFNEAVGETLQHWMRVVSFHCGSRRAEVRVPASDFLELILRSTWDSFGSFFRIRLPLLSVQTEVMERIVATAAARHYRVQRKMGIGIDLFSNGSAEASLAPLWRTLDRLHHQSASQNVAFRSALIRLAEKLKKLFRAYIAAHALSFLNRSRSPGFPDEEGEVHEEERNLEAETLIRASRISVHRVINASAGYSKQFLGLYSTSLEQSTVAHHEAVEDAFLDAADVFSPTELPDHRVAWLRKLAEFHESRQRFAEEATCHYHIHATLGQASRLHGALWSSTPFHPWTDNMSDGIHLDGEGPAGDLDDCASDPEEWPVVDNGRQIDKTNAFRRIFYRNENSIRIQGGLEAGTKKFAFFGVTLASEYHTVSPWISLREMEANMLEEAELAGELFLRAGIVASSRYVWSLATRAYAQKFHYGKLAHVYGRLARTVVTQIPPIDSSLLQAVCVAVPLGRFYRVWFHGGAPDELIGAEFVYRTASNVKLEQFGKELREVIRCIIPEKTPIHLVLDGRPEENIQQSYTGFSRMAGAPLEPVRVKVTPLRPLVNKSSRIRGLPEWFNGYIETTFSGKPARSMALSGHGLRRASSIHSDGPAGDSGVHHREHSSSFSASLFSSSGNGAAGVGARRSGYSGTDNRRFRAEAVAEGELVGADKFSFMQPINTGRSRGARDWLKGSSNDFAEKTLRVTQLQVEQAFPACVSRQAVVHRVVFTQSPLEAAVDAICQWCGILFRTAIATNGQAVLGINIDPGIGIDAAKVVSDCIHSSRVKEMGQFLLKTNTDVEEEDDGDVLQSYDRLGEDEVKKFQIKLARSLVVFMELIHLLIARNRDLLLDVIQERKKGEPGAQHAYTRSLGRGEFSVGTLNSDARSSRSFPARQGSIGAHDSTSSQDGRSREDSSGKSRHRKQGSFATSGGDDHASGRHGRHKSRGSFSTFMGDDHATSGSASVSEKDNKQRTDNAIAIQSELQRAFITLSKDLHPMIFGLMRRETPDWLKKCCQENYFSSYAYRKAKIPIGEELAFEDVNVTSVMADGGSGHGPSPSTVPPNSVDGAPMIPTISRPAVSRPPSSPGGSLGSGSAVSRGSDAARSVKSLRSLKSQNHERLASC